MSNNDATYYLTNISKDDVMFFSVCSQTGSFGTIQLLDGDDNVYFTATKLSTSTNDLQALALDHESAVCTGGENLRIEVKLNDGCNIKQIINSYNMTDPSSRILGCGYSYCLEDSTDNDFNDYYINVVSWKNKG